MVAKPLCPLYKNIIKPLDRVRYPELRSFLHFLSPKNASEIQALYSHQIGMQGVDSHQETYEVQETSQENAQQESTEIEQAAVSE